VESLTNLHYIRCPETTTFGQDQQTHLQLPLSILVTSHMNQFVCKNRRQSSPSVEPGHLIENLQELQFQQDDRIQEENAGSKLN
jgi:hypothetical protein